MNVELVIKNNAFLRKLPQIIDYAWIDPDL